MTKSVLGTLIISVYVNCSHCNSKLDLLDERDTNGHVHNVISQACPNGRWYEAHKNFEVTGVICGKCKGEFNVKGLEW